MISKIVLLLVVVCLVHTQACTHTVNADDTFVKRSHVISNNTTFCMRPTIVNCVLVSLKVNKYYPFSIGYVTITEDNLSYKYPLQSVYSSFHLSNNDKLRYSLTVENTSEEDIPIDYMYYDCTNAPWMTKLLPSYTH